MAMCGSLMVAPASAQEADVARVLDLVNLEREAKGCAPLVPDHRLDTAAERQAHAMAEHNFFNHVGPDKTNPAQRVSQTGYRWSLVAENLALGYPDAEAVVRGWMRSAAHRDNLLNCDLTETGLAMVYQPDDAPLPGQDKAYQYYWVQLFARPAITPDRSH